MKPSPAKCLALVLMAAFGLRLAAGWYWQGWLDGNHRGPFGFGDSEGYWVLARAIAHGEPYQYGPEGFRVFRTPGYPIVLTPVLMLVGNDPPVVWGRAFSAVLDTLAVAAVGWLAWRLFSPWAGVLAAAMAAVYPGSIAVGFLVLGEAPFCPLMLLHLGLWMAAWNACATEARSPDKKRGPAPGTARCLSPFVLAAGAGLAAGAATLVRPDWLLFIPFATVVGVLLGREKGTSPFCRNGPKGASHKRWMSPFPGALPHLWLAGAMLVGLAIVMSPWWLRNARVTGRFVPTTLQVGASLYDGWNPQATGASDWTLVQPGAEEMRSQIVAADPDAALSGDWEYQLDARLRGEAIAWALSNPGRVAELAAIKLARMWNPWPNEPSMSAWPIRWGLALVYVPILALGVWGAAKTIRRGWPYVLCWLPAVYFTLLHTVFVSSIRYRQPAMLGLMVLAGGVIARWRVRGESHAGALGAP